MSPLWIKLARNRYFREEKRRARILCNCHVDLDTGCAASRIQGVESIPAEEAGNSRHVCLILA